MVNNIIGNDGGDMSSTTILPERRGTGDMAGAIMTTGSEARNILTARTKLCRPSTTTFKQSNEREVAVAVPQAIILPSPEEKSPEEQQVARGIEHCNSRDGTATQLGGSKTERYKSLLPGNYNRSGGEDSKISLSFHLFGTWLHGAVKVAVPSERNSATAERFNTAS